MSQSNNVVTMPHAGAPTPAPAAGAPSQQWWGGYPSQPIYPGNPPPYGVAGCAPPCPPNSLMQCYCDIQNSMQFISTIMIDLINNNPAIADAMVAAIEKSGSALPLIGVTDGSKAQPGQVGEIVTFQGSTPVPLALQRVTISLGVLQPGDWLCSLSAQSSAAVNDCEIQLNPQPTGFSSNMFDMFYFSSGSGNLMTLLSPATQGAISVPTLIAVQCSTNTVVNGPQTGTMYLSFSALRVR